MGHVALRLVHCVKCEQAAISNLEGTKEDTQNVKKDIQVGFLASL